MRDYVWSQGDHLSAARSLANSRRVGLCLATQNRQTGVKAMKMRKASGFQVRGSCVSRCVRKQQPKNSLRLGDMQPGHHSYFRAQQGMATLTKHSALVSSCYCVEAAIQLVATREEKRVAHREILEFLFTLRQRSYGAIQKIGILT